MLDQSITTESPITTEQPTIYTHKERKNTYIHINIERDIHAYIFLIFSFFPFSYIIIIIVEPITTVCYHQKYKQQSQYKTTHESSLTA